MAIDLFKGFNRWLSNFHPCEIEMDGIVYPSVEHAFQAAKTYIPGERIKIRDCATPGEAKREGRGIAMRSEWELCKLQVMEDLLRIKFAQGTREAELLLDTDSQFLREGNVWHDNFWGECTCSDCEDEVGHNWLGVLLMKVRTELTKTT